MYPYIQIGKYTIASYGLCAMLGFLLGLILLFFLCRAQKEISFDDAVYIYTFAGLGALFGAKIVFLLTVFPAFWKDTVLLIGQCLKTGPENRAMLMTLWKLWSASYIFGGLVFYGGLLGAILTAGMTAKFFGKSLRDFYPVLLPTIPVLAGMGRIGCFLTGCCYGKETHLPIGILFHHSSVAPNGVALFPTQLLEAGFEGIMACYLVYGFYRKKDRPQEWLRNPLYVYLISYAVFRFFLEFFRGDAVRGMLFGLSTSQWISLIVIMICLLFIQKDSSVADKSRSNIR